MLAAWVISFLLVLLGLWKILSSYKDAKIRYPPVQSGWIPWLGCGVAFGKAPLLFIKETNKKVATQFPCSPFFNCFTCSWEIYLQYMLQGRWWHLWLTLMIITITLLHLRRTSRQLSNPSRWEQVHSVHTHSTHTQMRTHPHSRCPCRVILQAPQCNSRHNQGSTDSLLPHHNVSHPLHRAKPQSGLSWK